MLQRASALEEHVVSQASEAGAEEREQEEEVIGSDAEPVCTGSSDGGDASGDGDLSDVPPELRQVELEEGEAHELDGRIRRRCGELKQQQQGRPDEQEGVGGAARRKLGDLTGVDSRRKGAATTGADESGRETVKGAGADEEGGSRRSGSGAGGVDGVQGGPSQRLRRLRRGSAMLSSSGKSWGTPREASRRASARQTQEGKYPGDHSEPT